MPNEVPVILTPKRRRLGKWQPFLLTKEISANRVASISAGLRAVGFASGEDHWEASEDQATEALFGQGRGWHKILENKT
jgi:hypothetical protein